MSRAASRGERRRHSRGRRSMRYRSKNSAPFGRKYIALLEALRHSDKGQRLAIVRAADKKLIRYICECALNILKGTVSLKSCQKNRLRKYKSILRKLALQKGQHKNSWQGKKRVIVQKGGSFLPFLLQPILDGLLLADVI